MVKKNRFIVKTKLSKGNKFKFTKTDLDKDGKIDKKDCNPYDPEKQDFARGYEGPRTYQGYNVDDYYYSGGEYHRYPGAEPEEKKGFLNRMLKKWKGGKEIYDSKTCKR